MFKMTIEGATLSELASNILTAAKQFQTTPAGETTTTTKAKPVQPKTKAAEPEVDAEQATEDKPLVDKMKDAVAAADAKTADAPVDRQAVAKRCTEYAAKAGAPALQELFREFDASKWPEVTDDKLGAVNARLDELLG